MAPSMSTKKRLVADRFRRIWQITEVIAEFPGWTRLHLAQRFHLSERQMQGDLNIIRTDMGLPLVRKQGYRFVDEGEPTGDGALDLREAQLLVMILRQAARDRSIPRDRLASLMRKLPGLFPLHLRPLVTRTLEAVTDQHGAVRSQVFAALSDALLTGAWVKLHYAAGDLSSPIREPIVRPELLLPYLTSWYVLGEIRRQRNPTAIFKLDGVVAVTVAEVADDRR